MFPSSRGSSERQFPARHLVTFKNTIATRHAFSRLSPACETPRTQQRSVLIDTTRQRELYNSNGGERVEDSRCVPPPPPPSAVTTQALLRQLIGLWIDIGGNCLRNVSSCEEK